jgi:DNA-binding transcriptional regulator GbsR (MarR family)
MARSDIHHAALIYRGFSNSVISVLTEIYDKPRLPATMAGAADDSELVRATGALGARFVLHWGEMGARWGVNRTVSQVHALLFLRGRPMHAEELAALLQVARSNISTSLRELQNWDLVRVVHLAGDRRDHFETARDPWDLLRVIVTERKEREFDPTVAFLRQCVEDRDFARLEVAAQKRLRETLSLMEALSTWADQMLSMDNALLKRLVKMGAKIQALLRAA